MKAMQPETIRSHIGRSFAQSAFRACPLHMECRHSPLARGREEAVGLGTRHPRATLGEPEARGAHVVALTPHGLTGTRPRSLWASPGTRLPAAPALRFGNYGFGGLPFRSGFDLMGRCETTKTSGR